jgi:hypothetical protein
VTFLDDLEALVDGQLDAARTTGFAAGATSRQGEIDTLTADRDAKAAAIIALGNAFDAYRLGHPDTRTLLRLNLTGIPDGPLTVANLERATGCKMDPPAAATYTFPNTVVGTDSTGRFLRTTLKAGTAGGGAGIVAMLKLPAPVLDTTTDMDLRFSPGFDFGKGGKLLGPSGVAPGYPPGLPAGGQANPDHAGWSGRMMWLGRAAYAHVGAKVNELVSYVYHVGQADNYGDNEWWNLAALAGAKFHTRQRHVLNTVGKADGVLQGWLDGAPTVNRADYTYRDRADVATTHLMFSIFRGGDATWAVSTDGYVDVYDGLTVTAPV